MTAQTSVSRILFAMGREGVLPKKIFFRIHPRFNTPYLYILFVAAFSLLSLFLDLSLVVSMISFGALVAFTFVNLCVTKSQLINKKSNYTISTFIKYGLLPLTGVGLTLWLWTHLEAMAINIGLIWLAAGLIYLILLTRFFTRKVPSISHDDLHDI